MDIAIERDQSATESDSSCWFCEGASDATCQCGRTYCAAHGYETSCIICALANGSFEAAGEAEPLSNLLLLSLSAAARDPYIVVPLALQRTAPLPISAVERVVSALIKMLGAEDDDVRRRAVEVLAALTNSWPTMNPSQLAQNKYGIGLIVTDQLRRWLMHTLKQSRSLKHEALAAAILSKLRTADFRDLYPNIENNLQSLTSSHLTRRVCDVFDAMEDFYPTQSHTVNELCELLVYEQYSNRNRGASEMMQRMYGPLLRYAPTLRKLLKKGTWLSSRSRFEDWYFGEDEPV